MKAFSKKMLVIDYIVAIVLIVGFFVCLHFNGEYAKQTMNEMIEYGYDVSYMTMPEPYDIDSFGVLLGVWIAQLGVSSGAYYMMSKSDHKVQLPMAMLNTMPNDIKEKLDMTEVVTAVLNSTDN